jgi:hypothetical protein
MQAYNERVGTLFYRHEFNASPALSVEQHSRLPSSSIASFFHASSAEGKHPLTADSVQDHPFLSIIFDREDCLLPMSESDNENESDGVDEDSNGTHDPKLLGQVSSSKIGTLSAKSPMDLSGTGIPSPQRDETARSIHATHLRSRQPIVAAIRVHPNLNFRNLFGNMPFSSSVRTNNFPLDIQDTQIGNLFLPAWSMMTVNTRPDPGSLRHAFAGIIQEAIIMIDNGAPVDSIIEMHPNIAALFDKDEFMRSGILSKWAASMVHSVQLRGKPSHPDKS